MTSLICIGVVICKYIQTYAMKTYPILFYDNIAPKLAEKSWTSNYFRLECDFKANNMTWYDPY